MNIAQISTINGALAEGTAMRIAGLSRSLCDLGHSVTAVCASGSESLVGNFTKIDVQPLGALSWLYGPESPLNCPSGRFPLVGEAFHRILIPLPQICLESVRLSPILHCHQHWAASVAEGRTRGTQKVLFDYHGMIVPLDVNGAAIENLDSGRRLRLLRWQQRVFNEADGISFVTEKLRDRIVELYDVDRSKTFIIPDGVDFAHISRGWNRNAALQLRSSWGAEDGQVAMYVGSLDTLHGSSYLVQVVHELLDNLDNDGRLRLVIVGVGSSSWEFAELQRRFRGRLVFVPGISYSVLPTYLAAADILLVPHPKNLLMDSIESGKLLTYMASGKPTVVTRLSSTGIFLDDGVNSVLCDPDSPSTMVDGINRLVSSPDFGSRIGTQGASLVRAKRDWSLAARICTEVYHQLLSR